MRSCFSITSPFGLKLRFSAYGDAVSFTPIYPSTTLNEAKFSEMFRLEPRDSWRNENFPVAQFPSPYVFVSDNHVEVEQLMPMVGDLTRLNWRLIPGRFNIYAWQRPLNWAFEWDIRNGDLTIRMGDPLYWVRFYDERGALIEDPEILQITPSPELLERMRSFSGVTAMQRGTAKLINEAKKSRSKKFLD